jgi:branched-chain amino acid transport system ATP-binding protein
MLVLDNIEAVYQDVVLALAAVSLRVEDGSIVVLLGNNGSGKSTTLKSISGVLATESGKLRKGRVELNGVRIDHLLPEQIARSGLCHVLQGHPLFEDLTAEENLIMGAYLRKNNGNLKKELAQIYQYFPELEILRHRKGGYLSGGEQQMLSIGRALMAHPGIMLLDEPSLGLAPRIVTEIFAVIKQINREQKTTFLIAEQNAFAVLPVADYGYILQTGKVVLEGRAELLTDHPDVKKSYLGSASAVNKNYYASLREKWRQGGPDLAGLEAK